MNKILVLSPHPDDEAIGCGGTICKHIAEGDEVAVIFLTSGEKGGYGKPEDEIREIREEEARAAAEILGLSQVNFWRQPDGALAANELCIKQLIDAIENFRPTIIYVTHTNEAHPDHQAAAVLVGHAVYAASILPADIAVWMYEIWTPVQQVDHIVDISPLLNKSAEPFKHTKAKIPC